MMKQSTKAMIIARRLLKQGCNRADAMKKAWAMVKQPHIETKVSGVTYEKRQQALQHLTKYSRENIGISLERDKANLYDSNAVAVVASVTGKGSYCMGYLPKPLAAVVAPIMDSGEAVQSDLKKIAGGFSTNANYGMVIAVRI